MLKISVSVSRKIPGAADYSSDGFLCALEAEVSDSAVSNPQELRERMAWLWSEAKRSVEDQISQNGNGRRPVPEARPQTEQKPDEPATSRQVKYLLNLSQREHGMKIADLKAYLKDLVGESDPHRLSKAAASRAIESLVNGGGR